MQNFDITIIGGGIVGLAAAYKLLAERPDLRIALLEKESAIAQHQTGHNSGVIHSGIYYKPNSLKAINCQKGYQEIIAFAERHNIAYDICGKVIVATEQKELQALDNIFQRGQENRLTGIKKISQAEVKEIEPHVKSLAGIWVPQTGIIDYKAVAKQYLIAIEKAGAAVFLNNTVQEIIKNKNEAGYIIKTQNLEINTKLILNCAGLQSDRIAKMTMPNIDVQIIPFRGEYYILEKEKEYLVKNLIYPVPNPDFPFLGVHFTRMIGGGIEAGPNAVLAFQREGYHRSQINMTDFFETLTFSGFQKVAFKYWSEGAKEMYRSFSKAAFVRSLQGLIPEIQASDVREGGAGVRAQACDSKGNLLDDFAIFEDQYVINICNAPSPAATASLAIGAEIAQKAIAKL
jgi:(S)-2-hydroxyglutarate dehydrogenase